MLAGTSFWRCADVVFQKLSKSVSALSRLETTACQSRRVSLLRHIVYKHELNTRNVEYRNISQMHVLISIIFLSSDYADVQNQWLKTNRTTYAVNKCKNIAHHRIIDNNNKLQHSLISTAVIYIHDNLISNNNVMYIIYWNKKVSYRKEIMRQHSRYKKKIRPGPRAWLTLQEFSSCLVCITMRNFVAVSYRLAACRRSKI